MSPFVKMATLSSTFSGTTARNCYDASCTDGNDDCAKDTTTEISKLCMTCADTCAEDHACAYGECKYDNPWVQLDLNEPAMLRDFVIFNRPSQDLNGEGAKRLTGALEVYISNESFISPGGARTMGNFKDELLCYSACVPATALIRSMAPEIVPLRGCPARRSQVLFRPRCRCYELQLVFAEIERRLSRPRGAGGGWRRSVLREQDRQIRPHHVARNRSCLERERHLSLVPSRLRAAPPAASARLVTVTLLLQVRGSRGDLPATTGSQPPLSHWRGRRPALALCARRASRLPRPRRSLLQLFLIAGQGTLPVSSSHSRRVLPVKLPDAPLVYASVHRARPRDASWLRPQGLSLNIKAEEAMYRLHGGRLVVNGTFITEAHVATRGAKQKNATASF